MKLVVLGSGGWIPTTARMTTSVLLRDGDSVAVFDAGSGLGRLLEPRFRRLLPESGPIHIWLSHLHLDHTVGLSFLPALWSNRTVVHVAQQVIDEFGDDVLERLVGPPFYPHLLRSLPQHVTVEPAQAGVQDWDGVPVLVRAQTHPGGSIGFRVGDSFAFVTDTVHDPETVEFVQGVRLLMHEAWVWEQTGTDETRASLRGHTSAEDAARIALAASVGQLVLTHLSPLVASTDVDEMLSRARAIFPETYLSEDGLERSL
jgi:ribonuclease BN (tRNA processing enzyme)